MDKHIKMINKKCCVAMRRLLVVLLITVMTIVSGTKTEVFAASGYVNVNLKVFKNYDKAYKVLDLINQEREKEGLDPVVMDKSLLKTAMKRAAETALYWDHTRPNGKDCFTISDIVDGENIGIDIFSPEYIMNQWMESSSHKSNILDADWVAVGVGCIYVDGIYYWSQCFSSVKTKEVKLKSYSNDFEVVKVKVKNSKKFFKPKYSISAKKIKRGKKATITTTWDNTYTKLTLPASALKYSTSDSKIATVSSKGIVKAKKKGKVKIKVWFDGNKEKAKTFKVTVN